MADEIRKAFGGDSERQESWEHTAVRHVLSVLGLGRADIKPEGGRLTFSDFRSVFPTFPIFLKATKLTHPDEFLVSLMDMEVTASRRTYRFLRSRFYLEFDAAKDEAASLGRRSLNSVGLIFYHPSYQSLIMHSMADLVFGSGIRTTVNIVDDRQRTHVCVIEPFRQFVHTLIESGVWTPDESIRAGSF